ncbi:hypothetical protein XBFFL1_2550064 [Xenorhabdus bovienii str. feltiae Florida]|nr:hypothetical protein XBFFR1_2130001 [Xenorhabdus bovienii str. feltiae France]CDG93544.1 hypothetical protein XBFFL1_2550064 [Xenorhabdus bovienii str. feltiae Florida]
MGIYLIPQYISNTGFSRDNNHTFCRPDTFSIPLIGKIIDSFNRLYSLIYTSMFIQIYFSIFYITRQRFIKDVFMHESRLIGT